MLPIPYLSDVVKKWMESKSFDDPVDRLNYSITATLLGFLATMVSAKQYLGKPIQCIVPKEFSNGWEQYAEDYCFIQNTFYIPFNETIPEDYDDRREMEIVYYQWVPIVLVLQALMFFIPSCIWRTFKSYSGVDLDTVVNDGIALRGTAPTQREENCVKLKAYIADCIGIYDNFRTLRIGCFKFKGSHGKFMTTLYLFVKLVYLLNIMGQFIILNSFLGDNYTLWGWKAIQFFWFGKEWHTTRVFPRVTFCDFDVRGLGDINRFTVQCVLMINMFNEKIYLFIWFWFLFVGLATLVNFIYSVTVFISLSCRSSAIKYLLKHFGATRDPYEFNTGVKYFTDDALKADGFLIIRFLERNAGAIVARDITQKLFEDFLILNRNNFKKRYNNCIYD